MARSNRVRQLPTEKLVQEVADLFCALTFGDELTAPQEARWGRLVREIARRDYRFRAHGRGCTCADCWELFTTWQELRRRVGADVTLFVPHDE